MRSFRRFRCIDCGMWTERYRHPHQPFVCPQCGIARATNVAVELARAKADGWPEGGRYTREQFAAPQRARWARQRAAGVK